MKSLLKNLSLLALLLIVISSCQQRSVTRVSPDQTIDLSGRWNDTDARLTAEAMIQEALGTTWLTDFTQEKGSKPVVIVGFVKNKSAEHIDAEPFLKDLEKAFINSGRVRVVQGGEKREQIRAERADQQEYSSSETIKKWGKEVDADFILQGSINQIVDTYNNERVNFYQVNLELTNMETNEIVWIGDKKIKKYINK